MCCTRGVLVVSGDIAESEERTDGHRNKNKYDLEEIRWETARGRRRQEPTVSLQLANQRAQTLDAEENARQDALLCAAGAPHNMCEARWMLFRVGSSIGPAMMRRCRSCEGPVGSTTTASSGDRREGHFIMRIDAHLSGVAAVCLGAGGKTAALLMRGSLPSVQVPGCCRMSSRQRLCSS